MDLDGDCEHKRIENEICIDCGKCMDNIEYRTEYCKPVLFYNANSHKNSYRSTDQNKLNQNITKIKNILLSFNLECYVYQIRDLLLTSKFKSKICLEDKILLSLYYLVKLHSFPITLQDLLKYTKLSKFKLLKIYRDTFDYIETTDEYLYKVYERIKQKFQQANIVNKNTEFNDFLRFFHQFRHTESKLLCIGYFYEVNEIKNSEMALFDDYTVDQILHVRRKIKSMKEF